VETLSLRVKEPSGGDNMKIPPRLVIVCALLLAFSAYMSADDFTFYLSGDPSVTVQFEAQIYAWNGNLFGGHPTQGAIGNPFLNSGPFSFTGTGVGTFSPITINAGALHLAVGNYVALFTISYPADYAGSNGSVFWGDLLLQHVAGNGGGGFNFYNNGSDFAAINSTPWDDFADFGDSAWTAHFGAQTFDTIPAWNKTSTIQPFGFPNTATYGQTFVITPEPGTMIMFGSGMLALAGVLRRKINL